MASIERERECVLYRERVYECMISTIGVRILLQHKNKWKMFAYNCEHSCCKLREGGERERFWVTHISHSCCNQVTRVREVLGNSYLHSCCKQFIKCSNQSHYIYQYQFKLHILIFLIFSSFFYFLIPSLSYSLTTRRCH